MKTLIVPISGGKDSQVCLSLAKIYCSNKKTIQLVCVHQNTGFDHSKTYRQMELMEKFYDVKIEHTKSKFKTGMLDFLAVAKYFPNSSARGCTERLKQEPFAKWLIAKKFTPENSEIWFGMRSDESKIRNDKYGALTDNDKFTLGEVGTFYADGWRKKQRLCEIPCRLPIVTWTQEEVFSYIKAENAPLNALYAAGHHRVGCYPCLLSRKFEWQAASRDPEGRIHLAKMIALQEQWAQEGNPRKFIKVHRVWDVKKFLEDGGKDLPEAEGECGWCSI